jgi:hypothetical protein
MAVSIESIRLKVGTFSAPERFPLRQFVVDGVLSFCW